MLAAQDGDQSAYGALLAEILPMLRVFASGQREAIELTKVQGLSLKEASAVTGKSVASLKVNIHRAVKALRRSITTKT